MDGNGRALDNIFTERLWRMVKYEEVHLQSYSTPREARQGLACHQHGGWDGLGFAFSVVDPYCGIDLDNCREPETGEIAPWARQIVEQMQSYTEISVSGRGLHILVKAELSDRIGRKHGAAEIYDAQRYFALTGELWWRTRRPTGPAPSCAASSTC